MNSEDDFRREVIDVATRLGGHVSHIESHQTSAGIPDLIIYLTDEDLWLELKVIKDKKVHLRPTQKRWHADRAEAGGMSWVLVLDPLNEDILVVPGRVAATLDSRARSWRAAAGVSNVPELPKLLMKLVKRRKHGKRTPDRERATKDTRSPQAPLSPGSTDVDSHHWLLDQSRAGVVMHGSTENGPGSGRTRR